MAAAPLMSVPLEAAVGEVLAFFSVEVGITRTADMGKPNCSATIAAMRALTPCPISTAPVETCTVPSVWMITKALPWFKNLVVKEIPNFTAVKDRPRGFPPFSRAVLFQA